MRWLILFLCLSFGAAQSQEASHEKPARERNQKAKHEQGATTLDTTGLENAIRESIKEASEKPDKHSEEKAKIDRDLAEYTRQLSVYTEQLSKYTRDVADFTLALVVATIILGVVGVVQGGLFLKELVTANRPILVARKFQLIRADGGKRIVIRFIVANVGRSKAIVTLDNVSSLALEVDDIKKLEEQHSFPPFLGNENVMKRKTYAPTKRLAHEVVLSGIKDAEAVSKRVGEGTVQFVCYGIIRYRDVMWGKYETYFYRIFKEGHPFMEAHPDYDYDDHAEQQYSAREA